MNAEAVFHGPLSFPHPAAQCIPFSRHTAPGVRSGAVVRVLMVSRARYTVPLAPDLRRKFEALEAAGLDLRVLAAAASPQPADPVFRLAPPASPRALDGLLYYLRLPGRVARELRTFRPDVVLVQGVHECTAVLLARALARSRVRVVLDVQGNWRAATRLYGSSLRNLLNPLSDLLGRIAIRRADAVRTIGPYTTRLVQELGRDPDATLPTYVDSVAVSARPPAPVPDAPCALFVGVLERYKGIDTLLDAWPLVLARIPNAMLRIVGRGRRSVRVAAEAGPRLEWTESLSNEEITQAIDDSSLLVLPSPMEGLGRVTIEAFARGRAVVGVRDGGTADLVEDGRNGLLVGAGDPHQLADALVRVLGDHELAVRLGAHALESTEGWLLEPDAWAARFASILGGPHR